ncbi:MAG: inositol monophosphatase family protein, partial [Janthinobacterium lividum]
PSRLACRRVWVVDPIDGTRDFIRGRTGWAVSVALVEDGVAVIGCLAAPARGQVFVAARGQGATLDGVLLQVSGRESLAGARLPIDAASLTATFWPDPWDAVPVEKPNSLALRIGHVASGFADAFIEGRTISEWDIAAAALILTEAGGTITDRDGAAIGYNRPNPAIRGIAATTPALHDAIRRQLDGGLRNLAAVRSGRTI